MTLRRPVRGDVEARVAIGRYAEIVRAYGRSFDPAAGFTREHAKRPIAFLIDQPDGLSPLPAPEECPVTLAPLLTERVRFPHQ